MSVTASKNAQSYRVAGRKSIGSRYKNSVAALQRVYLYSSPVSEMLGRKGWLDVFFQGPDRCGALEKLEEFRSVRAFSDQG